MPPAAHCASARSRRAQPRPASGTVSKGKDRLFVMTDRVGPLNHTPFMRLATDVSTEALGKPATVSPLVPDLPERTQVYIVNGCEAVCKLFWPKKKWTKELVGMSLLSSSEVPVPTILAKGCPERPPSWIVMTFIPGRRLFDVETAAIPQKVYTALGVLMARMHEVGPYSAFGMWPQEGLGAATLSDWACTRARHYVATALGASLRGHDVLVEAARYLRDQESSIHQSVGHPARFLHRDFNSRNVLVGRDWEVTGILDFERSEPGDPAEDFARLALGEPAWKPGFDQQFLAGYTSVRNVDKGFGERVLFHLLTLIFEIANWAPSIEPAYYEEALQAARRLLSGIPPLPAIWS